MNKQKVDVDDTVGFRSDRMGSICFCGKIKEKKTGLSYHDEDAKSVKYDSKLFIKMHWRTRNYRSEKMGRSTCSLLK